MRQPSFDDLVMRGIRIENDYRTPQHPPYTDPPKQFMGQTLDFDGITWHFVGNASQAQASQAELILQESHSDVELLLYPMGDAIYVSSEALVSKAKGLLTP